MVWLQGAQNSEKKCVAGEKNVTGYLVSTLFCHFILVDETVV